MRQDRFTLENIMKYIYDDQIAKIPAKYYNMDAQTKYLKFGSSYTYCCHGNKRHHMSRWIRERLAYVDSMLDYFVSQDDQITIRMNKTGLVTFDVTTYIPLYFSVKWNNSANGTQRIKMDRGETKTFSFNSTVATDQEVIVYHAQHIKRLDNLSNLNPSSCILSNAIKLNEVEIHSTELYNINVTNNKYLRRVDLSNCPTLGTVTATGSSLDLSNCKYLKYCDVRNTALTEIQLNTSGGSLKEIYYPKTIQSIELIKQRLLETIGLPYGENGEDIPTALYNIDIEECPMINRLNMSDDDTISNTFASMVYCNNLTLRNALDLQVLSFDGFHRLMNVVIENMYNLEELGFNNLLPVGQTSTLKYVALSNCPKLEEIELNCTSDDYEITLADNAVLDFGRLYSLKNITSNCVLKGLTTLVVPNGLESMFFTNEYGSGYSSVENIWASSVCSVSLNGAVVNATHMNNGYKGIDFLGMNLKNIDLGALVNIPKAINFSLSPTHVNPNFNLNRDGQTYPYLQPVGTLDLSNYTGSLAKFFNGVDLDKLTIICNNDLPQNDLSYCFYNSTFSGVESINALLSRVSNITNLDYCFYKTTISDLSVLEHINMGTNSTMNYTFAECPNITELRNVVIPASVVGIEGLFFKCPITSITNMNVYVNGSIAGLFKGCNKLETINTLRIPDVTSVASTFEGCTILATLTGFELPTSCTDVSNLFNGCYSLTSLGMDFGENITSGENWFPPNLETLYDTNISTNSVKLTGCTTLKSINNLKLRVSNVDGFFNNCSSLRNINGLDIGGTLTSVSGLFKDMNLTLLQNITFSSSITNFTSCFENVPCVTDEMIINMPDHTGITVDYSRMFAGCLGITKVIDTVYPNGGSNFTSMYEGCTNITRVENVVINGSIVDSMFKGCSRLTQVLNATFENATTMNELFANCIALETLDTVTFGENIVNAENWIKDTPVKYANNITINSPILSGNHSNTLENVLFRGCRTLTSANNIMLGANITKVTHLFNGCSNLQSVNLSGGGVLTDVTGLFMNCTNLSSLDISGINLSNCDVIGYLFYGCSSLKVIENITFGGLCTFESGANADLGNIIKYSGIETIKNCTFNTPATKYLFCTDQAPLKRVEDITIGTDVTDLSGMFQNCKNLLSDISIPRHVTNCSNMFNGCTLMTHIHSNWNNTYDNGIASTDCYSGCTGITHIDNSELVLDEYSTCLDKVPEDWGGYGFEDSNTSVVVLDIPSDGYEVSITMRVNFGDDSVLFSRPPLIAWGDNSSSVGDYVLGPSTLEGQKSSKDFSHTYAQAGKYVVKLKNGSFDYSLTVQHPSFRENIYKIVSLHDKFPIEVNCFRGSPKLVEANISNAVIDGAYAMCYCSNLTKVIANNVKAIGIGYCFYECSNLTEIVGLDTWNTNELTQMPYLFAGTPLTSLDDIADWNTENVVNMSGMFNNCSALASRPINIIPDSVENISNLYKGCPTAITEDISGMVFGSGITEATDWIDKTAVKYANNVTIKNNVVKFKDFTSLIECNDLDLTDCPNAGHMFNGCTSLTGVSLYPPKDPVPMNNMFYLSTVLNIECLGSNKMTPTNAEYAFREMPSTANYVYPTDKWDFSKCTRWIYTWYGTNANLLDLSGHTLNLKYNENPFHHGKILNLTGATIFLPDVGNVQDNMNSFSTFKVVNLTNATIKGHFRKHFVENRHKNTGRPFDNSSLKEVIIDGAVFADEESRNWEGIFEKCIKLQKDVIIPNNITNVTNAFRNCTSMTHIHSNWEENIESILWDVPTTSTVIIPIPLNANTIEMDGNGYGYYYILVTKEEDDEGGRYFDGFKGDWNGSSFNKYGPTNKITFNVSSIPSGYRYLKIISSGASAGSMGGVKRITAIYNNHVYTNGIISTDCYAGCTGITHIDGVELEINEYTNGLDKVPEDWGGTGFNVSTSDYAQGFSIYKVTIPKDNYTLTLGNYVEEGTVSWGDGSTTKETKAHTYAVAGDYVIKGKIYLNTSNSQPNATAKACVTDIIKHMNFKDSTGTIRSGKHYLTGMTKLKTINMSGISINFSNCFSQSTKFNDLTYADFTNCEFYSNDDSVESGNYKLGFNKVNAIIDVTGSKVLENGACGLFCALAGTIIGLDTLDMSEAVNGVSMFDGSTLSNLDDVANWDVRKIASFESMFANMGNLINLDLSNWQLDSCTSLRSMFRKCSLANYPIKNIPDTCTMIGTMYYGNPTSLYEDISGFTFGAGITNADSWCSGSRVKYANNVTIKNDVVKFKDYTSLIECKNLDLTDCTNMNNMFNGCTNLTEISLYPPKEAVTMAGAFYECTGLLRINYLGTNKMTPRSLNQTFCETGEKNWDLSSSKWDLSQCVDYKSAWRYTTNTKVNLQGQTMTIPSKSTYIFYQTSAEVDMTGATITIENRTDVDCAQLFVGVKKVILKDATISGDIKSCFHDNRKNTTSYNENSILTEVDFEGATFGEGATDWTNIFQDCIALKSDVIIPNNITNVTNAFKNCTNMTHIHSNWNNTYDNGITPTDCYAGCTGITHIDGVELEINEYTNGLDKVPEDWGGYGFEDSNTSVVVLDIPSDNYEVTVSMRINCGAYSVLFSRPPLIAWGDNSTSVGDYVLKEGNSTKDFSHTYAQAGKYVVKLKNGTFWYNNHNNFRENVYKIVSLHDNFPIINNHFKNSSKLVEANISNAVISGSMSGCPNLTKVIANNVKAIYIAYCFRACSNLTEIIGLDTWNTDELINMRSAFGGTPLTSLDDIADWNTENVTDMNSVFDTMKNLTNLDFISNWNVKKVTDMGNMFISCYSLTSVDLSGWDTSNVTNLAGMFNYCRSLTSLDLSSWDVGNVTSMDSMFNGCASLTSLNMEGWNTGNVDSMKEMFLNCSSLTSLDLSSWNVENVTNTQSIFSGCSSLTSLNLSGWNTESLTNMSYAFHKCSSLQNLDLSNFKTGKVESLSWTFESCKLLTDFNFLNSWDVKKVQNIACMLQNTGATGVLTLNNWDLSNAVRMENFLNKTTITDLNLRLTSNRTDITVSAFACSAKLANWDGVDVGTILKRTPSSIETNVLFPYTPFESFVNKGNVNIKFYGTITRDMDIWGFLVYQDDERFGVLRALSVNSIVNLLELLEDYTGQDTATLQLGSYTIARLSAEQIKIATDKNWTLV